MKKHSILFLFVLLSKRLTNLFDNRITTDGKVYDGYNKMGNEREYIC